MGCCGFNSPYNCIGLFRFSHAGYRCDRIVGPVDMVVDFGVSAHAFVYAPKAWEA